MLKTIYVSREPVIADRFKFTSATAAKYCGAEEGGTATVKIAFPTEPNETFRVTWQDTDTPDIIAKRAAWLWLAQRGDEVDQASIVVSDHVGNPHWFIVTFESKG